MAFTEDTYMESIGITGDLSIDSIKIDGTTIGHKDDTDLLSFATGALTVNGTIESETITANLTGNVNGDLTGDVTGNVSGSAGTVSTIAGLAPDTAPTGTFLLPATAAAQPNITSVGTLTALTVDARLGFQVKNEDDTGDNGTGRIQINSKASLSQNTWELAVGGLANRFKISCPDGGSNSAFLTLNQSAGTFTGGTIFDITTTTGASQRATLTFDANNNTNDEDCFIFNNGNANFEGTCTAAAFSGPLTGDVTGTADTANALGTLNQSITINNAGNYGRGFSTFNSYLPYNTHKHTSTSGDTKLKIQFNDHTGGSPDATKTGFSLVAITNLAGYARLFSVVITGGSVSTSQSLLTAGTIANYASQTCTADITLGGGAGDDYYITTFGGNLRVEGVTSGTT